MRGESPTGTRSLLLRRIAANLAEARAEAGLTQGQLAERSGLHRTEISLIEREGREPRLGTLVKLADALGIPPRDLWAGIAWDVDGQCFKYV